MFKEQFEKEYAMCANNPRCSLKTLFAKNGDKYVSNRVQATYESYLRNRGAA